MLRMIVATGWLGEIGKNNSLLWDIPEDLKLFKEKTEGSTVIMGKNTFDSLPFLQGLPNRVNYVLTSKVPVLDKVGYRQVSSHLKLCNLAWIKSQISLGFGDFWVIGGASVYEQFKDLVEEVHWTVVSKEYPDADTHMDMSFVDGLSFERVSLTNLAPEVNVFVFKRIPS